MKIDLYMKDGLGRKAQFVGEGRWYALDLENVEAVKNFEPVKYCEIVLFLDNGDIFRHVSIPWGTYGEEGPPNG
jgi:hypothetical protein